MVVSAALTVTEDGRRVKGRAFILVCIVAGIGMSVVVLPKDQVDNLSFFRCVARGERTAHFDSSLTQTVARVC